MYLQFACYVAAMGDDGVDGYEETVGNLLVLESLYDAYDDIALSVAERFAALLRVLEHHLRDVLGNVIVERQTFETLDGGSEDMVLDLGITIFLTTFAADMMSLLVSFHTGKQ